MTDVAPRDERAAQPEQVLSSRLGARFAWEGRRLLGGGGPPGDCVKYATLRCGDLLNKGDVLACQHGVLKLSRMRARNPMW